MDTTNKIFDISDAKRNGKIIYYYMLFWSLSFLLCVLPACIYSGEGADIFRDFYFIIISPSNLITDYFNVGGLGSTFLNVALCGLSCNLMVRASKARANARILAGYFLVVAHCFYGLNFLNMWPTVLGVFIYCRVTGRKFGDNLHTAMFSTALAPFASDFLFRYTIGEEHIFGMLDLSVSGVVFALAFGIAAGFAVPALLPATTEMTRGYSLYKAGLAIGILGMFVYSFLYKSLGISAPAPSSRQNFLYEQNAERYALFMNIFFVLMFSVSVLAGFFLNGRSLSGYSKLLGSTGYRVDFIENFGAPDSLINLGVFGLFIVLYFNVFFLLPLELKFTAPTSGVIIAAVTFCSSGQTPKNVWPIGLGYLIMAFIFQGIAAVVGADFEISSTTQGYINSFAFATGLCPFAGRYGWHIGVVAGMLNAIICTSTSALHGGFVLYNGGFTAGLTALVLLTVLDFYEVKIKHGKEKETNQPNS